MSLLKVALLQIFPDGRNQKSNLLKGLEYCRKAKALGADIAVFPEMWNVGYKPFEGEAPWKDQAINQQSEFIHAFKSIAKELDMAIVITYLEEWNPHPRNSASLIDRHGNVLMTYAKVHTCDFRLMEAMLTPGDSFPVCGLDTQHGTVQIGMMICMDRGYPESARILMLNGAEIILSPNESILDEIHLIEYRARASENTVGVATASYPYCKSKPEVSHLNSNGHSAAFTQDGSVIAEGSEGEEIVLAAFDLNQLREDRRDTFWGASFRKPHRYGALVSNKISEPYIRNDAFGSIYDPLRR